MASPRPSPFVSLIMHPPSSSAWALALLLLTGAPRQTPAVKVRPLADFPEARTEIGKWMKLHGWKSQRNSPRRWELGDGRLHLVSDDDSVLIGTEAGLPLDPANWPRLRFRLRVDRVPIGTDLSEKSGDDAAFRLYVAFDEGGSWLSPPDTIAYTWSEDLEPGTLVHSPHYTRLHYLSIGKGVTTSVTDGSAADPDGADPDGWVTIERDLLVDYRRVFGERAEVPDVVGIMLKCDSNDSATAASAWLADLALLSSPGEDTGSSDAPSADDHRSPPRGHHDHRGPTNDHDVDEQCGAVDVVVDRDRSECRG